MFGGGDAAEYDPKVGDEWRGVGGFVPRVWV